MALPGRAKDRRTHQLALALELARREQGLKTSDLATALSCSPRTVRRYLNGERRPSRETVVAWEVACRAATGSLTRLYDRQADEPIDEAEVPAHTEAARRFPVRHSAVAAGVAIALAATAIVLVGLRAGAQGPTPQPASGPRLAVTHRFPAAYVGTVWARIAALPAYGGQNHLVTLHWGPKIRQIVVKGLGPTPRSLLFAKNGTDDTPLSVTVQPPAKITFGIRIPPDPTPVDINAGWTTSH